MRHGNEEISQSRWSSSEAVEYPARTPPSYFFLLGLLALFGAWSGYHLIATVTAGGLSFDLDVAILLGLGLLVTTLPVLYYAGTREYRARGTIRIDSREVVVPDPRGQPVRFPADELTFTVTHVKSRPLVAGVPIASVSRGAVVELRGGGNRRRISTLTLVDRDQGDALIADLERVCRGEPPQGPVAQAESGDSSRDEYDERLDRELEKFP